MKLVPGKLYKVKQSYRETQRGGQYWEAKDASTGLGVGVSYDDIMMFESLKKVKEKVGDGEVRVNTILTFLVIDKLIVTREPDERDEACLDDVLEKVSK